MSLGKRVVGIVYAYDPGDDYALLKETGVEWVRLGVPFPWADRMHGAISQEYRDARKEIEAASRAGFHVMPSTAGLGGYVFVASEGRTRWVDSWPEFCGTKGTPAFMESVRAASRWIAQDLGGMVGPLWQVMNEIDIETFRGDYSPQVAADTARASAEGILSAQSTAMCGTNLANYGPDGLAIMDLVCRAPHPFAYVGDDQYFGSWQGGSVEDWVGVMDGLYDRYGLPVLANEWGYSSAGPLKPVPGSEAVPKGWASVCAVLGWHNELPGGHTEEMAARYFRRGLEIFATHPHCLGSFMFCWKDARVCYHCGQAGCPAECAWGIVDVNGKPKPAYHAVKEAIGRFYGRTD
ncbi:MAG TPA: hypothetical protein VFH83_10055 [Spirochaetia bacterium]|nr:hypothetical protein [Spirochaetia bacterium]